MSQKTVLLAEDDSSIRLVVNQTLVTAGYIVRATSSPEALERWVRNGEGDIIVTDVYLTDTPIFELLPSFKLVRPELPIIVMSGQNTILTAAAAAQHGAFDYLQKPCKLIELQSMFQRIAEKRELTRKCHALQSRVSRAEGDMKMIGDHSAMNEVRNMINKVAPSPSTVLILGETGTGKELAARAVHDQSPRAEAPFVAVNCGALPENLIESELFGHRKGAFTGADANRVGLFEVADGGTLFLDEIGELPKSLQAKLLRVLESGEIRRVGDNQSYAIDVRIVCATHRDLPQMVADGEFREDLMYRINTFEIHLPALRERLSDVPQLAVHLLARNRPDANHSDEPFSKDAIEALMGYTWPGNVRELANVIEHASILCDGLPITAADLPRQFGTRGVAQAKMETGGMSMRQIETMAIESAMDRHNGNKTAVAEELGISLKTLYNKLNQAMESRKAA